MKILIVDDEPPARARLRSMIETSTIGEVVGEAGHGRQALEQCEALQPEVVLMDIRMPGMDGLEAAAHIGKMENPPAIIFTTAYDEYALAAFKTHAVDYLLKPVRQEQLSSSIQASTRLTQAQRLSIEQIESEQHKQPTHISARVHGNVQLIPVETVYYFYAEHKYVTVRHKDGEVLIEDSLKTLEQRFPELVLRVHRNALVLKNYVAALEKDDQGHCYVRLRDCDDRIEISRRHLPDVRKYIKSRA